MVWRLVLAVLLSMATVSVAGTTLLGQTAPLTLDELIARHGSSLVTEKWLEGLKDLHHSFSGKAAYEANVSAAEEAIAFYEKGDFHVAALRFGEVFRAVVATPSGTALDSLWAAILFRGREVAWSKAIEGCTRQSSSEKPRNSTDFAATFLGPARAEMKSGDSFKAHCRYSAAFEYLVIEGDALTESFPAEERDEASREILLGLSTSLVAATGPETSVLSTLESVRGQMKQIKLPGDVRKVKAEAKVLLQALQEGVEFTIAAASLQANVAWMAAQNAQQKGDMERYVAALREARNIASGGVWCETRFVILNSELGAPVGRSVEIHRLAATLNQNTLQVLLPKAQMADPQSEKGLLIMLEANQAMEEALTSLAVVVDHDSKDWASRLVLAQLVILQKGRDTGKGAVLSGDTATAVLELIQSAQEIGTNEAECQYNSGSLLQSARLGDPRPALKRFLKLAPNDPRVPQVKAYLKSVEE